MKNTNLNSSKKHRESTLALVPESSEKISPQKQQHFEDLLPQSPKSRSAKIAVPTFDGLQMILIDDIIKCVAHESYTEIILTCDSKFMVSRNLKEYEEMLSGYNFFRIHNSCLINLRHVKKYIRGEGGYVQMVNGHSCEVSRRKKAELLNRLFLLEF